MTFAPVTKEVIEVASSEHKHGTIRCMREITGDTYVRLTSFHKFVAFLRRTQDEA